MVTRALVAALSAALLLSGTPTVVADTANESTISVGAYVPFDAEMQEHYGQVWPALMISRDLGSGAAIHRFGASLTGANRKVSSGFLTDAFGVPRGAFRSENNLQLLGLTYTFLVTPTGRERGPFLGAGAGAHVSWSEAATTVTMGGQEDKLSDEWFSARGALHAVAGYHFSPRYAVEARYVKMLGSLTVLRLEGKDTTANADGLLVTVGYRW